MFLSTVDQIVQIAAWSLCLVEIILALYVLVLNAWHTANRHMSMALLVIAMGSSAAGMMVEAQNPVQAHLPAAILAAFVPAMQPALFLGVVALFKPEWLKSRWRWIFWLMYAMVALPILVTAADHILSTYFPALGFPRLWFTGLDPKVYTGGFVELPNFTKGILAPFFYIGSFTVIWAGTILLLVYLAIFNKKVGLGGRIITILLLLASILAVLFQGPFSAWLPPAITTILSSGVFAFIYAYATFQQMISERRLQKGSLQYRLTLLVVVASVPIIVAVSAFIGTRANLIITQDASQKLGLVNQNLSNDINHWIANYGSALQQLAASPEIRSMDPVRQKPLLEAMVSAYSPELYLASTVDLSGMNVSRSDYSTLRNYSQNTWYEEAKYGANLAYEVVIGQTTGRPALVFAMPIYDSSNTIQGVVMIATELSSVSKRLESMVSGQLGEGGLVFVVDDQNRLVVHPDQTYFTGNQIVKIETSQPLKLLRSGNGGASSFLDEKGQSWLSYTSALSNRWAVVVQGPESNLLGGLIFFRNLTILVIIASSLLLSVLAWLAIRQAILPIDSLTATAQAIIAGDLNRSAPVDSQDELGLLANTFNRMTTQLRELIGNLEKRVADRTKEVERRYQEIQVAATVARDAASIRDLRTLLDETTVLITQRFGFYHAGIFLLDPNGEYAVLEASNSEGGKRMLARGHRLKVGQVGIVGYVAQRGEYRIALDVGADAVFFNNPDLPNTRSEMALPLRSRGQVIGVLDVQSTESSAFTTENVNVLQVVADQVALAIESARLLSEREQSLAELETMYTEQARQAWRTRLGDESLDFIFNRDGVARANISALEKDWPSIHSSSENPSWPDPHLIVVPVIVRKQVVGTISLKRESHQKPWTADDLSFAEQAASQVASSLENARLLEQVQARAQVESLVGQISTKIQSSMDLESVIMTAVREIGQTMNAARVQIRLEENDHSAQPSGNGSHAQNS